MLRRLVGWLFGFGREIGELEERVRRFAWDPAFGMYTRAALLAMSGRELRGRKSVVFLDLDRVHELNLLYGYAEVDRRIRAAFSSNTRRSDMWAARWWSGDEVLLVLDCGVGQAEVVVGRLQQLAQQQGLSFTYAIGEWDSDAGDLPDVVERLSTQVLAQKVERGGSRTCAPACA
jgi:GGDEF domain-containing protein